ncbi:hypothetical protein EPA93_05500 [Ktedonosporobacter rubrisoli]|uniref:Methylamine utilisation protein MauE domain-containing protein n=1 Tax=Ktedonosporobacter rubrisoli TaxID=2509675 RepID=A0A4P6JLE9_KTERU|nr:MauE/DoxX family redox-associated membrane protein [Ktedonosporobacter rubrisoli]QBD75486.1 hypothetical protein EPA93_05500 [Ktedonosporobacter rubrisoli]
MLVSYIFAFCRVAIGLLFLASFIGKLRAGTQFRQTINDFRLISPRLSQGAATLFLCCELAIVVCMIFGNFLLLPGFLLATLLLCVFSGAIALGLLRKRQVPCNCFGASSQVISPVDLYRNAGLLLCAAGGCGIQSLLKQALQALNWVEWLPVALGAAIFVLLWTQLGELIQLFRPARNI